MIAELSELNFDSIGTWPRRVKLVCIVLVCTSILMSGYWVDIHSKIIYLNDAKHAESQLQSKLTSIQQFTATLPALSSQLNEMQKSSDRLLLQLPTYSDVPGFLEALSRTGIAAGLKFLLFKPLPEEQKEFYAELPIEISVEGNYHQIASFITAIASLNRMVTLRDFTISPVRDSSSVTSRALAPESEMVPERLVMNMILVTYRDTASRESSKHLLDASPLISPIVKSSNSFVYTANKLRSPFQKTITQSVLSGSDSEISKSAINNSEINQDREPLESYPLESLRLVGTVSVRGQRWGLVTANGEVVYHVKKGDVVGQLHGIITNITNNKIIVTEKFEEEGIWKQREIELVLISHEII
jgi:type IV pilus assembly protein PilO